MPYVPRLSSTAPCAPPGLASSPPRRCGEVDGHRSCARAVHAGLIGRAVQECFSELIRCRPAAAPDPAVRVPGGAIAWVERPSHAYKCTISRGAASVSAPCAVLSGQAGECWVLCSGRVSTRASEYDERPDTSREPSALGAVRRPRRYARVAGGIHRRWWEYRTIVRTEPEPRPAARAAGRRLPAAGIARLRARGRTIPRAGAIPDATRRRARGRRRVAASRG